MHIPQRLHGLIPSSPNRRGAVLLLFGAEFLIIGFSMMSRPTSTASVDAYTAADRLFGFAAWGVIWATCGVIGILAAWWPTKRDDLGFYLMSGLAALWAGMAVGSWLFYDAARAWSAALLWGVHALLLLIISGMDRDE